MGSFVLLLGSIVIRTYTFNVRTDTYTQGRQSVLKDGGTLRRGVQGPLYPEKTLVCRCSLVQSRESEE